MAKTEKGHGNGVIENYGVTHSKTRGIWRTFTSVKLNTTKPNTQGQI